MRRLENIVAGEQMATALALTLQTVRSYAGRRNVPPAVAAQTVAKRRIIALATAGTLDFTSGLLEGALQDAVRFIKRLLLSVGKRFALGHVISPLIVFLKVAFYRGCRKA
jgi:hypothetical protein